MFSFIFGASTEGRSPPTIQEGHKAVEVVIDGERLKVDVDVLAEVSGLFLQVQVTDQKECPLLDFPGGLERFRDIVGFLVDQEPLAVTEETVLDLMEATWLLECPRAAGGCHGVGLCEIPFLQKASRDLGTHFAIHGCEQPGGFRACHRVAGFHAE